MGVQVVTIVILSLAVLGLTVDVWIVWKSAKLSWRHVESSRAEIRVLQERITDLRLENKAIRAQISLQKPPQKEETVIKVKSAQQMRALTEAAWGGKPDMEN